jgi:hypothetical protein
MSRTTILVFLILLSILAVSLVCSSAQAFTFSKSSKIAMVPNANSNNGGGLYTGTTWPDGGSFTFSNVAPADIANGAISNPITAGGYDTVVLMAMDFNFATYWADTDFSNRITDFVNAGGKLIIYTSEFTSGTAFSNFLYPFTVDTPGQTGSFSGTLTNLADDTLSSNNSATDTYPNGLGSYIDLSKITSQTDAVGDLTVMTSYNSHWYIDMFGKNVNNVGGPGHTYAFYGNGLIIFNGLDVDYASGSPTNANGAGAINMIWWRELCAQELGPSVSVNGLTLTPASDTNLIPGSHTLTATVRNTQTNNPVSGVVVTFSIISGPNIGLTGSGTTNVNGTVTFTYSSSTIGTDTIQASIPSATGGADITSTATKEWVTSPINIIPEVPFGTLLATTAMCLGFISIVAIGKIRKTF